MMNYDSFLCRLYFDWFLSNIFSINQKSFEHLLCQYWFVWLGVKFRALNSLSWVHALHLQPHKILSTIFSFCVHGTLLRSLRSFSYSKVYLLSSLTRLVTELDLKYFRKFQVSLSWKQISLVKLNDKEVCFRTLK